MKYRTVHTGANSRFGGRQDGLARCSYQSPGRNTAPPRAATKQATIKPNSASREKVSMVPHLSRIGRWPNAMVVAQAISSARNFGVTSNSGTKARWQWCRNRSKSCAPRGGNILLAPAFRTEPWNAEQGPGFTEKRNAEINACDEAISGTEFGPDTVCLSIVRVVEPAALPMVNVRGL